MWHHLGNDWWIMGLWDKGHGTMATISGNECGTMWIMIVASWHGIMGNGKWNMCTVVLRCETCIVPIHLHFPLLLVLQETFLSLCALFFAVGFGIYVYS